MPIYEYECSRCASRFELRKSFDEEPFGTCPDCGGEAQRVFIPVPIIFKGSGFYVTDSRGKQSNLAPGGSTGGSGSDGGGENG